MKSVNQVILLGHLTKDPELRYTPSGTPVVNFSIATNRSYKDKETQEWKEVADFHNVIFWGKAAEIISQFMTKGKKLYVEGRMQTRKYEDKERITRYVTEVVGSNFVFCGDKPQTISTEPQESQVVGSKPSKSPVVQNGKEKPFKDMTDAEIIKEAEESQDKIQNEVETEVVGKGEDNMTDEESEELAVRVAKNLPF